MRFLFSVLILAASCGGAASAGVPAAPAAVSATEDARELVIDWRGVI